MIIVDLLGIVFSNLMIELKMSKKNEVDEHNIRTMVLNSIRRINKKFKGEYGELIIAYDASKNWRKDVFPYYKANRKKSREDSDLNWDQIFPIINKVADEINQHFPYRCVKVDKAEADDVIGVLCHEFGTTGLDYGEKIMIVSRDKDFKQLQVYGNVKQYDPIKNKMMIEKYPEDFLKEHIIRGDGGDGVPNVLSNDNVLVIRERQKTLTAKKFENLMKSDLRSDPLHNRNFCRNEMLIDLKSTPVDIKENILKAYEDQAKKTKMKIYTYFVNNNLKELMGDINDF